MFDNFKTRMERVGKTQGSAYLHNANVALDATFKRDPAYREVIITHAPSEIDHVKYDAKFSIHSRRSIKALHSVIVHYNRKLYNESI